MVIALIEIAILSLALIAWIKLVSFLEGGRGGGKGLTFRKRK